MSTEPITPNTIFDNLGPVDDGDVTIGVCEVGVVSTCNGHNPTGPPLSDPLAPPIAELPNTCIVQGVGEFGSDMFVLTGWDEPHNGTTQLGMQPCRVGPIADSVVVEEELPVVEVATSVPAIFTNPPVQQTDGIDVVGAVILFLHSLFRSMSNW